MYKLNNHILIALSLILISCSQIDRKEIANTIYYKTSAKEWIYFYIDSMFDAYYNIRSIEFKNAQYAQVWVKTFAKNEEAKHFRVNEISKLSQSSAIAFANEYSTYAYTTIHYEMDCKNKIYRWLTMIDYDKKDNKLNQIISKVSDWKAITVSSLEEKLFHSVCK